MEVRTLEQQRGKRRRLWALAQLSLLVPLGLLWRLAPLHLSQFAFKYGGSVLWAMAVYWLLAALLPRWRVLHLSLLTTAVATVVEFLKLLYWPPLDRFRETLPGKLLLGRYFTVGALLAYWLAIAVVSGCDAALEKRSRKSLTLPPRR